MTRVAPQSREPVGSAERGYISEKLKLQVLVAHGGRCCKCGKRLVRGDTQFDHVLSVWLGGLTEVGNLESLCVSCHAAKTKSDAGSRAKVKRLQAKNMPQADENVEPKQAKYAMKSRPFDTRLRKKMDGSVVPREAHHE